MDSKPRPGMSVAHYNAWASIRVWCSGCGRELFHSVTKRNGVCPACHPRGQS